MKKIIRMLFFLGIFSGMLFSACEPVEEGDETSDPRDNFTGVWRITENQTKKDLKAQSYIVTITKNDADSSQVFIENFGNPGTAEISAIGVVTTNQIVVSPQNMSNGWEVEGSGKMSNVALTQMTWTYVITAGGDKEYYTATATRQ
jgi:hypothetical protein